MTNKMWYIFTMENYSGANKNEIMIFAWYWLRNNNFAWGDRDSERQVSHIIYHSWMLFESSATCFSFGTFI